MVFKTIYLYLSIGPWIQEKNVMSQNKLPLLVVQLKGQGSDFWHWPSITQGEICSSSMRKRNANQREGQSNAMQFNAKQNKTKQSYAMQCNWGMHCQMLVAKICNGGKQACLRRSSHFGIQPNSAKPLTAIKIPKNFFSSPRNNPKLFVAQMKNQQKNSKQQQRQKDKKTKHRKDCETALYGKERLY